MRFFCLLAVFALHSFYSYSGTCTITGELKSFTNSFFIVEKPINGLFNNISYEARDTVKVINNRFATQIECKHPVFITLLFSDHPVRLIVKPSDQIELIIDFNEVNDDKRIICKFYGTNAKGQELFYFYNYQPVDKFQPIWNILKNSADTNFTTDIKAEIGIQIFPFKNLYKEGSIDTSFYSLVSTSITSLLLFEAIRRMGDLNI